MLTSDLVQSAQCPAQIGNHNRYSDPPDRNSSGETLFSLMRGVSPAVSDDWPWMSTKRFNRSISEFCTALSQNFSPVGQGSSARHVCAVPRGAETTYGLRSLDFIVGDIVEHFV